MDDDGWFVTAWMIAGMLISALVVKPLMGLRWFAQRNPRLSFAVVLGACGVMIGDKIFTGQIDRRVLSMALIAVIFGFARLIAVMTAPRTEPCVQPAPADPNDWFLN